MAFPLAVRPPEEVATRSAPTNFELRVPRAFLVIDAKMSLAFLHFSMPYLLVQAVDATNRRLGVWDSAAQFDLPYFICSAGVRNMPKY